MIEQQFIKFPTTPYLLTPDDLFSREDKVLSDKEAQVFFSERVLIEEKIDGANLGISFSSDGVIQLQNRGHYIAEPFVGQWKPLSEWIKHKIDKLFDLLLDRYIVFGEWCYIAHSVYYNSLPDWFIAFDIYDKQNESFLSSKYRNEMINQMALAQVPQLYNGHLSKESIDNFIGQSAFGMQRSEGLYFRVEDTHYLKYRAKYVRKDFSQSIETHWTKKVVNKNQLRDYSHYPRSK